MKIAYGNRICKSTMSAQVSKISIRRILLKSYMEIAYENGTWKARMEIASVGASFANFDSAGSAELLYEKSL